MRRQALLGTVFVLLLAGCSPWSTSYSCRGYPEGVQCKSAREVYELTNYRDSLAKRKDGKYKDCTCPENGKGGR